MLVSALGGVDLEFLFEMTESMVDLCLQWRPPCIRDWVMGLNFIRGNGLLKPLGGDDFRHASQQAVIWAFLEKYGSIWMPDRKDHSKSYCFCRDWLFDWPKTWGA